MKTALILFSGISFLVYGVGCFTSRHLKHEFVRYGFSAQRKQIGFLQICGAAGLLVGLWVPLFGKAGAGGLALMMLFGILVRIKIHDNLRQTTPAVLYFLVNTYLVLFAY